MEEAVMSGGGLMSSSARVGTKCGRWNPTAEQVKVLSDLFSSGLRTPTTEQIQMISSHLSSFGKIESKNVFYWFQNHKARERHHHKKRRRGGGGDLYCCTTTALKTTPDPKKDARGGGGEATEAAEMVWDRKDQREIETLELFPLSSYKLQEQEKWRSLRSEWRSEMTLFNAEIDDPPLDLRLSFL